MRFFAIGALLSLVQFVSVCPRPAAAGADEPTTRSGEIPKLRAAHKSAEALPLARKALAEAEQREGRDSLAVARALVTIAELYVDVGNRAEAEPLFKRAIEILSNGGAEPAEIAAAEGQLAQLNATTADVPLKAGRRAMRGFAKQPTPDQQPQVRNQEAQSGTSTEWDIVPVFFGTDRAEIPNSKRAAYGSDRGRRLDLGRALVTVPKAHQVPNIERPWALHIPYFDVAIYEEAEDPKQHFTLQDVKRLQEGEFLALVRERMVASSRFKDHAMIFVHGYNTSFDNALYRTAQIAYDMQFDGVPYVYSWPSGGGVTSYTYDRESAEGAEPHLRKFIDLVLKETGATSVSIIAHSMGNQALLNVLRDINSRAPGALISQLILAAPDVDTDNFTNLTTKIAGLSRGMTLYAASNDRALIASRNFWRHARAGDVPATGPLVLPGIDTIDVTAASTDIFGLNHSGYAQNNALLTDIGKLVESGVRPPETRFDRLKPVSSAGGAYWRYAP